MACLFVDVKYIVQKLESLLDLISFFAKRLGDVVVCQGEAVVEHKGNDIFGYERGPLSIYRC